MRWSRFLLKINYINKVPHVRWIEEQVDRINVTEGFQYAVIGRFSSEQLDLDDLRLQRPKQFTMKGGYNISLLRNHHILIRFDKVTDFVNVMAQSVYYINSNKGYS